MFEDFRRKLARALWPKSAQQRMYHAAKPSRLAGATPNNSSADTELATSLVTLRGRSRQLVRDSSYAKRARTVITNNVVGTGIGMQAQVESTRKTLNVAVNDAIEEEFAEWACGEYCHVGGTLHFHDLERVAMAQVFEAGEVFIRKHRRPMPGSTIPLALELIEAERVVDGYSPMASVNGNMVRMGVEVDNYYRPVGYWVRERHPSEFRLGTTYRDEMIFVPASDMYHLRIVDRWPQTRGEPWLHTAIRRLQDLDGYSEAEIVAARSAASYMGFIKTPDDPNAPIAEKQEDGSYEMPFEPGMMKKLKDGEDIVFHDPKRPNTALDPFMRYMLREVAAGIGVSYASLSMDYSQSNYSSSRLALLDDRDLWRYLQLWFIRMFRMPLHKEWLQAATLSGALKAVSVEAFANDMRRYHKVKFKPRGWSWIDPTSEVEAYIKAVRAGFTDVGDVISKTADGRDLEEVLNAREQELTLMEEKGLEFDTDPKRTSEGAPIGLTAEQQIEQQDKNVKAQAEAAEKNAEAAAAKGEQEEKKGAAVAAAAGEQAKSIANLADAVRHQKPPQTLVTVEAPVVNNTLPPVQVRGGDVRVEPQSITVSPGAVNVDVAPPTVQVAAPQVHVEPPKVTVEAPQVRIENKVEPTPVSVAAPEVRVENKVEVPEPKVEVRVDAPQVHVEAPKVTVQPPQVTVEAPQVRIENKVDVPPVTETVQHVDYNDRGDISAVRTTAVRK